MEPLSSPLLNDKGQVVVLATNGSIQMFLPTPDYGRGAGVHTFPLEAVILHEFNNAGTLLLTTDSNRGDRALWKGGAMFRFNAVDVYGLNNSDQVIGFRNLDVPDGTHPQFSSIIASPDGTIQDVVYGLPHKGVAGRDSTYFFYDMNDHGVLAGRYAEYRTGIGGTDIWYPVTWGSRSGGSVRVFPSSSINGATLINNKNQLWGFHRPARVEFLYLPAADYGMTPGFHDLDLAALGSVPGGLHHGSKVTDHGEIFIKSPNVRQIWYRGRILNPSKLLTDGKTSDVLQIHDVNNNGAVLGTGAIVGKPNRLVLYEPGISATVVMVPEEVTPGETFEMRVTISNESDKPFVLAGVFGESYQVTGSALPGLIQLANPPATRFVAPGQSWRQDFPFKANRHGEARFSFQVVGFHADGKRFLTDRIEPVMKVFPAGDLLIKRGDESVEAYSGDDLYLTQMDARQHRYAGIAPGQTNRFQVRIQNDAAVAESFRLRATAVGIAEWEVKYFQGATDITGSVLGNGWETPELGSGGATEVTIQVRDDSGQLGERLTLRSYLTATDGTEAVDAVTVITVVAEVPIKTEIKRVVAGGYEATSVARGLVEVEAPLELVTAGETLEAQPTIAGGWVADGVTPLLVKLSAEQHALLDFPEGRRFRLDLRLAGGGQLEGKGLSERLRLLKDGAWVAGNEFELAPGKDTQFAMLTPVLSDEARLGEHTGQLTIAFEVVDVTTGRGVGEGTWLLRKPPVALIHGYNTTGDWGNDFVQELGKTRPLAGEYKWIKLAKYGQDDGSGEYVSQMLNTLLPLAELVPLAEEALEGAMAPLRQEWAFTRYDVVCHSQGGLLTRMLCSRNTSQTLTRPFRNELNHNRGRFHRVVTLGSPHNGTRLLRYLLALNDSNFSILRNNLPTLIGQAGVFLEVAQEKFDPFGIQIRDLNNPSPGSRWAPDPGAKFHLLRSTVNAGQPPYAANFSPAYTALGLYHPQAGPAVLPRGSDGVVDFDSMGAHGPNQAAGANVFTLPPDLFVSHSPPLEVLGADAGQTASVAVGAHVRAVLDQDKSTPAGERVLAGFAVPELLGDSIREQIDHWAQVSVFEFLGSAIDAEPVLASAGPNRLVLATPADRPVEGGVSWIVEAFTRDGVVEGEVPVEVNGSDSRRVSVNVPYGLVGDVVLYANYLSTNGAVLFAEPFRVFSSEPAGTSPVGIEVEPKNGEFPAGSEVPVRIATRYGNGQVISRHVRANEVIAVSSATSVVSTTNSIRWRLLAPGTAEIVTSYRGFSATNSLVVFVPGAALGPTLRATKEGASIVLRWPASEPGYVLETATELAPGATWEPVASPPTIEGSDHVVTHEISNRRFFRLRKPEAATALQIR